jgi:two-component system cell cycle response regulator
MSGRVLVVDDTELNVRLLEEKLSCEYFEVLSALSGAAGLEIARREVPDVVLLDLVMPDMDGLAVCRRLKADPATRHIPVVIITAGGDMTDRLKGLEAGADDFLTKPINDVALFARLRSLIRLKRTIDEWLLREEIQGGLAALQRAAETPRPASVLIVEDHDLARERLLQILSELPGLLFPAENGATALQMAVQQPLDLVVVSLNLVDEDPLRIVSHLRSTEQTRSLPIMLVSDDVDYQRLAKALDLGANDYVVRPVERSELLMRAKLQIKRKRLQDKLVEDLKWGLSLALTDSLTGLYNRRYLMAHLEKVFDRPLPAKGLAALMFDIDQFKRVNDTYGHSIGDEVLAEIGRRILTNVRGFDLVARYGGEEFITILPETTVTVALKVAERLRRAISRMIIKVPGPPGEVSVTISIGVAVADAAVTQSVELLRRADEALYAAKNAGRNRVVLWNDIRPDGPALKAT